MSGPKSRQRDRNIKMKSDLLVAWHATYRLLVTIDWDQFEYLLIGQPVSACVSVISVVTISSDEYD